MLKIVITVIFANFVLIGCLAEKVPKQIIVDGEATIMMAPETFSLSGEIRARNPDKAKALEEIAAQLALVYETLPRLEGPDRARHQCVGRNSATSA